MAQAGETKTKASDEATNYHPLKLYGLDHLRVLAILQVFLFHYFILSGGQPAWLPDVAEFGWTGVDLFFVLSGFLISSQLFAQVKKGQQLSFRVFFVKRFFRIVPAYWVTVGLYFCFPFFREKEHLPPLWKFLTFTQNLGLNLKDFGTFSHAWSLCVEEHFYLFLPLILLLLQATRTLRNASWLLVALFLAGFILRIYSFAHLYLPKSGGENQWRYWYQYLYYPTYNRLDGLLVGVAIAVVYRFQPGRWKVLARYGNQFLFLGLLVLAGACFLCRDQSSFLASVFGYPLIAVGYGCLVVGAISPCSFLYRWQSRFTTFLATLSYALYLTHKGVIHLTHRLLAGYALSSHLLLLVSVLACLAFAFLLHRAVERPFMRLRSRVLAPK